jgi:hypothetical protein
MHTSKVIGVFVSVALLLFACEADQTSEDVAETPACSGHGAVRLGVSVAFADGTPADHACPAWWRAGPAIVDSVTADEVVLSFQPDGPQVTLTLKSSPALTDGLLVAGDTVDAAAFHESCEHIVINDAFFVWRQDGQLLLFAESRNSVSNAREWRNHCDDTPACPKAGLPFGAPGCVLPNPSDPCTSENRLLPVLAPIADDEVLIVESAGHQTLTLNNTTWQATAYGWVPGSSTTCTDQLGSLTQVVAVRTE